MNPRRLRIGEWITGAAGVALLAVMFLDWYENAAGSASAWEALSILDVLLAIAALMGIATAVMAAAHDTPAVSLAIASLLLSVGTATTVALLTRVIWVPDVSGEEADRALGLWLGLGACVALTLGALASMRDERFPPGARVDVQVETLPPPEGGKA